MAANNTIGVSVNVTDGGSLGKVESGAKAVNEQLKAIGNNSKSASKALQGAGGTMPKSAAMAKDSSTPTNDQLDYKTARGLGGSTGAAGRDFAKQSQGLGGLVHIYATFAANLFAVSAAFSAMKNAADTTNMIKGLDQLGAASGRNLGTLSKEVAKLTDGAVSLREAMTSVAQASAAGMTGENIKRMTVGAKNASAALGIGMPDALSRLSRGISKIEPELLDEIGIFVKVDKAAQDYARTLGKSASELTDFEKRAGFAKAVLEQLDEKFGKMETTANPFSKLLASLSDILQVGLEFINKVLGPIAKFLAESPVALVGGLTAAVALLGKMAIPTVNNLLDSSKEAAEKSVAIAKEKTLKLRALNQDWLVERTLEATSAAEKEFQNEARNIKKIEALKKTQINSKIVGSGVTDVIRNTSAFDISQQQLMMLEKNKTALLASEDDLHRQQGDKLKKYLDKSNKLREESRVLGNNVQQKLDKVAFNSREQQLTAEVKKFNSIAAKASITSSAVNAGDANGPVAGFSMLNAKLKENKALAADAEGKLSAVDRTLTRVGTGAKLVGQAVVNTTKNMIDKFGTAGMVVAILVGALEVMDNIFTKNAKEFERFSEALGTAAASVDGMSRTVDTLGTKNAFSVSGLQARANALEEVSNSVVNLSRGFTDLQQINDNSGWDKFVDGFWDAFGKGSADKLSTNLSKSISAGLKGIEDKKLRAEAKSKLEAIVGSGIDLDNSAAVEKALRNLSNQEIANAGKAIAEVLNTASIAASKLANNLTSVMSNLTELGKLVQTQVAALNPTDSIGKIGSSMVSQSKELTNALKDPINNLLILNKLAKDSSTLSLLPPATAGELIAISKSLEDAQSNYSSITAAIIDNEKKLATIKAAGNDKIAKTDRDTGEVAKIKEQLAALQSASDKAKADITAKTSEISSKIASDFINVGLAKLNTSLNTAMAEGAITAAKAYSSALKSAGMDTSDMEARIRAQELGVQKQILEAAYEQAKAVERNSLVTEINSTALQMANNLRQQDTPELSQDESNKLAAQYKVLEASMTKSVTKLVTVTTMSAAQVQAGVTNKSIPTDIAAELGTYLSQLTGYSAGMAKIGGQAEANRITDFAGKEAGNAESVQKTNKALTDANAERIKAIDREQSLNTLLDSRLEAEKSTLNINNIILEKLSTQAKLQANINTLEFASSAAKKPEDKAKLDTAKARAQIELSNATAKAEEAIAQERLRSSEALAASKEKERSIARDMWEQARKDNLESANAQLSTQQQQIEYLRTIGAYSDEMSVKKLASIELDKQALAYEDRKATIEKEASARLDTLNAALARSKTTNPEGDPVILQQIAAITSSKATQLATAEKINEATRTNISLLGEQNALLAKQKEIMEDMGSLTVTLGLTFGKIGAAVGASVAAITKFGQAQQNNEKRLASLKARSKDVGITDEEALAIQQQIGKIKQESAISELNLAAEVAGESKKMFAEKTGMYKALNAIEAANHAAAMVMQAEKMAAELAALPTTLSGAFGKLVEQSGWAGFAGIAALLAAIASVGGGGGSASIPTPPKGINSEDRQKTQGTGQSWENNKIVEDKNTGVFGDTTAKTESIANSLEIVSKNSFESLRFSSQMVNLLTKISEGINGVAKTVYSTVGITSGSAFGNADKVESGKSFLGFGKSTTKEIQDSGIKIVGTFKQIMEGLDGTVQGYETMLTTTTKKSWFGSKVSNSVSEGFFSLGDEVNANISSIFNNAADLLVSVGKNMGKPAEDIVAQLANIPVNALASLRGLQGADLEKEFSSVMSNILDSATSALFADLVKFRKFGEGMLETAIRLSDQLDNVNLAMESIGRATQAKSMDGMIFADAIARTSGGLDTFVENTQAFGDAFLTEEERLAPIQRAVTARMTELGFGAITTRDQFKQLVLAYRVVDESSAETYADLLAVSSAFDEVTAATTKALSAEDLKAAKIDQSITILQLEGRQLAANNILRAKELEALDENLRVGQAYIYALQDEAEARSMNIKILTAQGKADEALVATREEELSAMSEILRPYQKYLYALEDEQKAKTKLTDTYKRESAALKTTISTLGGLLKTLEDYSNTLKLSALSSNTPKDTYAEAKKQLDELFTTALSQATSDTEIAARNDAINKIPSAANSFLEASRTLYASSERYNTDYTNVLGMLNQTTAGLTAQKSAAEEELKQITSSARSLGILEEVFATYWEDFAAFDAAKKNAEALAPTINLLTTAQNATAVIAAAYYATSHTEQLAANTYLFDLNTKIKDMAKAADLQAVQANYDAAGAATRLDNVGTAVWGTTNWTSAVNAATWTSVNRLEDINYVSWENHSVLASMDSTVASLLLQAEKDAKIRADQLAEAKATAAATAATAAASASAANSNSIIVNSSTDTSGYPIYQETGFGALAKGGMGKGWNLVGELGPELVNFENPGRVYTAEQTRAMISPANDRFSNQQLVDEIRDLNKQIAQLRKEQNAQTGALIASNYDANQRAASTITESVETATTDQQWALRTQVKVA